MENPDTIVYLSINHNNGQIYHDTLQAEAQAHMWMYVWYRIELLIRTAVIWSTSLQSRYFAYQWHIFYSNRVAVLKVNGNEQFHNYRHICLTCELGACIIHITRVDWFQLSRPRKNLIKRPAMLNSPIMFTCCTIFTIDLFGYYQIKTI